MTLSSQFVNNLARYSGQELFLLKITIDIFPFLTVFSVIIEKFDAILTYFVYGLFPPLLLSFSPLPAFLGFISWSPTFWNFTTVCFVPGLIVFILLTACGLNQSGTNIPSLSSRKISCLGIFLTFFVFPLLSFRKCYYLDVEFWMYSLIALTDVFYFFIFFCEISYTFPTRLLLKF